MVLGAILAGVGSANAYMKRMKQVVTKISLGAEGVLGIHTPWGTAKAGRRWFMDCE